MQRAGHNACISPHPASHILNPFSSFTAMTHVAIYDTTLRDGAQGEGVNFSLQDKLLIARRLDELGFDFVEGGYPLSNPKDTEFFQRIAAEPLKYSRVCAFGMTRRRGVMPADDPGMKALIDSRAPLITIVAKT